MAYFGKDNENRKEELTDRLEIEEEDSNASRLSREELRRKEDRKSDERGEFSNSTMFKKIPYGKVVIPLVVLILLSLILSVSGGFTFISDYLAERKFETMLEENYVGGIKEFSKEKVTKDEIELLKVQSYKIYDEAKRKKADNEIKELENTVRYVAETNGLFEEDVILGSEYKKDIGLKESIELSKIEKLDETVKKVAILRGDLTNIKQALMDAKQQRKLMDEAKEGNLSKEEMEKINNESFRKKYMGDVKEGSTKKEKVAELDGKSIEEIEEIEEKVKNIEASYYDTIAEAEEVAMSTVKYWDKLGITNYTVLPFSDKYRVEYTK